MKYSGTIVGFLSSYGSIYNIVNDDSKCYAWKANVNAEISGKMLNITFTWNAESYELRLSLLKEHYYTGKLFFNKAQGGEVYLWAFMQNDALLLKGDFIEEDSGSYDIFVELRKSKA